MYFVSYLDPEGTKVLVFVATDECDARRKIIRREATALADELKERGEKVELKEIERLVAERLSKKLPLYVIELAG